MTKEVRMTNAERESRQASKFHVLAETLFGLRNSQFLRHLVFRHSSVIDHQVHQSGAVHLMTKEYRIPKNELTIISLVIRA